MVISNRLVIITGLIVGFLGAFLVLWGNPVNMGICVACFVRDIAGGIGFHRAEVVQYIRPEVIGFVLGAFLLSIFTGEFKPRGGSAPMIRFFLGALMMIGALAFLGCPLRMILRLAAGDLNAVIGLLGFAGGIWAGGKFLKMGFSLGPSPALNKTNGFIIPGLIIGLFILFVFSPGLFFSSTSGPGSLRAPLLLALGAGLLVGALAQRSRLCTAGALRDLFLIRNPHLFYGVLAIFLAALIGNLILGNFSLGFSDQPVAHTDALWNFLGLGLVGITAVLLGGCPLRQLILSGEGNTDSGLVFLGMMAGAGVSHNFGLAGSPAGLALPGQIAVIAGLILSLAIAGGIIIFNKK